MSEMVLKTAWRRNDERQIEDAKAFWTGGNELAAHLHDQRAQQLGVLAYSGDRVVAAVTAELEMLPGLRARFAVFQVIVDPEFRRNAVARRIVGYFLSVLEAWSAENPQEEVMGIAAVIQAAEFKDWQREPVWPDWGLNLTLIGYTPRNQQIRVAWFRHARI
ncbi:MAG TPA: hypothetical protein VD906_03490 [Caulobacteraceae bacterium]|nr:hypothetical protein [Caulobacteraceae bacterium]